MRDGSRTALGQLQASHRRHDERLAALVAVSTQLCGGHGGPSDLDELDHLVSWFARSVPRHFADEDAAVFPRLAARYPAAADALAALTAEHPALVEAHESVARMVRAWGGAEPPAGEVAAFLAAVHDVATRYADHAAREDVLMDGMELDAADDAAALEQMERHRGR